MPGPPAGARRSGIPAGFFWCFLAFPLWFAIVYVLCFPALMVAVSSWYPATYPFAVTAILAVLRAVAYSIGAWGVWCVWRRVRRPA